MTDKELLKSLVQKAGVEVHTHKVRPKKAGWSVLSKDGVDEFWYIGEGTEVAAASFDKDGNIVYLGAV